MQNHLKDETSPYLLQHVENPVDWYPWGKEAFERAKEEDKPIFLSIGYSTCHWCHVMAHESFEDAKIAELLNKYFISIKVDKEERPDIDSIYMSVCQTLTGSGGWPMTIFMTPEQKPFYAGTYFSKTARYGKFGLGELLLIISKKWRTDRKKLLQSAEGIVALLSKQSSSANDVNTNLTDKAVAIYKRIYDEKYGGFGEAPKFPTPHNLLFLMNYYDRSKDGTVMEMVEKTLLQMHRGGVFDHIGWGFSRYSTDQYFLAPHFEKMLYDNALLMLAYCRAYEITKKSIYRRIAEKTAAYILREMTDSEGGFYSAQDADSEGVEGKYYLFEPSEITAILGEHAGQEFNRYFDITEQGNFEGKNIPNLLRNYGAEQDFEEEVQMVYKYRKQRHSLHLDDKILTSWNALMIASMCYLYRISKDKVYLEVAEKAQRFIENKLCKEGTLFVSYRKERRGEKGFLDDYANEIFALLTLYEATLNFNYLKKAQQFCEKVLLDFYDEERGGFFLYSKEGEQLILRPKETYDGAVPSGNSVMAYNLVRFYQLIGEERYEALAKRQVAFMCGDAKRYPVGYAMFLVALSDYLETPEKIVVVVKQQSDVKDLPCMVPLRAVLRVLDEPTNEYPLKNDKTTFYICRGNSCLPPTNEVTSLL